MLMGLDNAHHTKSHIKNSMLWPYSLGYWLLGLYCYAYDGNNLRYDYFALRGIISCPDPLL